MVKQQTKGSSNLEMTQTLTVLLVSEIASLLLLGPHMVLPSGHP